jgi:AcrR family transcriptional regulator
MIMAREMQMLKHELGTVGHARGAFAAPRAALTEAPDAARMLQLIQAAETIFLEKGYHSATMNDVAKAAGMSKKTVYKLIDSKAGLFAALMDHHAGKLKMPVIQDDWTENEILVQVLLRIGQFILSPEQIAISRLIMTEYTHSNDFGRIFHQAKVRKAKTLLQRCLTELGPPGYRKVAQVRETAAMLFGMALGEFHLSTLVGFRPVPTKAALARRIRRAVALFLTGCERK